MPNWASNIATIKGPTARMQELKTAFDAGNFCQSIRPITEQEYENCRKSEAGTNMSGFAAVALQSSLWGTKWDFGSDGVAELTEISPGFSELKLSFETAWSPPLPIYQALLEGEQLEIKAYFYEPGMCYAGIWDDGTETYFENWEGSKGAEEMLPEELIEAFDIVNNLAMWED